MSEPHSTVLFRRTPRALSRQRVRKTVAEMERSVTAGRHFTVLLTGDAELQRLNRQFLGHDYPTDVLSFPEPGPDGYLGELAISLDRASDQARRFGHTLQDEIGILLLHGLLHLTGMDHEKDKGAMSRAERRFRKQLGLPSSLIERVPR